MRFAQVLLIAALLVAASHLWKSHERSRLEREVLATANSNGFVPVEMPSGAPRNTALILAPVNCPHEGAQRADAMAHRLSEMGIPNVRTSHYAVETTGPPAPELSERLERSTVVLNGQIPIVLINGMGKANPTVDEVASEYRRAE
jgi:hypothetical protein